MLKERRIEASSPSGFHLTIEVDLKAKSRNSKLECVLEYSNILHKTEIQLPQIVFEKDSNTETGINRKFEVKN